MLRAQRLRSTLSQKVGTTTSEAMSDYVGSKKTTHLLICSVYIRSIKGREETKKKVSKKER